MVQLKQHVHGDHACFTVLSICLYVYRSRWYRNRIFQKITAKIRADLPGSRIVHRRGGAVRRSSVGAFVRHSLRVRSECNVALGNRDLTKTLHGKMESKKKLGAKSYAMKYSSFF